MRRSPLGQSRSLAICTRPRNNLSRNKGNSNPMQVCNNLASKAEKQQFYNQYLKGKKFDMFAIEEKHNPER